MDVYEPTTTHENEKVAFFEEDLSTTVNNQIKPP